MGCRANSGFRSPHTTGLCSRIRLRQTTVMSARWLQLEMNKPEYVSCLLTPEYFLALHPSDFIYQVPLLENHRSFPLQTSTYYVFELVSDRSRSERWWHLSPFLPISRLGLGTQLQAATTERDQPFYAIGLFRNLRRSKIDFVVNRASNNVLFCIFCAIIAFGLMVAPLQFVRPAMAMTAMSMQDGDCAKPPNCCEQGKKDCSEMPGCFAKCGGFQVLATFAPVTVTLLTDVDSPAVVLVREPHATSPPRRPPRI